MYLQKQISDGIFYVGVNDRTTDLFEVLWELPKGVSYNSYLIVDEKIVLIDTVDAAFSNVFIDKLDACLQGRAIDYLVINHMEPDHSASIKAVKNRWPNIKIVGNSKTFTMLNGYFGINENLVEVKEGSEICIGKRCLQFIMTPMVHWIETMMTYDKTEGILFSGDAFGCFGALNGAVLDCDMDTEMYFPEMERYYAGIVGKYGSPVQKAIEKLSNKQINMICSTHGPVWKQHVTKVIDCYNTLSLYKAKNSCVIIYGSMHGNTAKMAETIADSMAAAGLKHIIMHDLSRTAPSELLADVFRCKGLILGCPTYSNELFPPMSALLDKIKNREIKHRYYACFGSCSWAGTAKKKLEEFGEQMQFDSVYPAIEEKHAMKEENFEKFVEMGRAMATKLLED